MKSGLLLLVLGLGLPGVGLADGAKLVQEATTYLRERQARMNEHHGLGGYERYDWDQEARRIVFSNAADSQRLIADIVFVGSVSNRSGTWLWSWANPSVDVALSRPVRKLREFGEQRKLKKLQQAKWPGDEVDGWEMTSIAAYVLKADGAYRTADDDGFTYMLLFNVRKSRQ